MQESHEQVESYEKYSKAMNDLHKDELDRLTRELKVVEDQKTNLLKRLEVMKSTVEAPKSRCDICSMKNCAADLVHCFFY